MPPIQKSIDGVPYGVRQPLSESMWYDAENMFQVRLLPMYRLLASIVCCLLLTVGPGAFTAAAQSDPAHELIQLVNEYRAANGMPPLAVNSALMIAAQRQADWQAINYIHSHQGEGGTMPQDRATAAGYQGLVSENVASGTLGYVTPAWAVQGWANSYGHRMTMLSQNVHIGTGVAENDEESFYVLVVGSPSASASKPPTGAAEFVPEEAVEQPAVVVPIVIATPREDGAIVHVVQDGQTAWAIAARYGVPLDDLLAINHVDGNATLHPGDELIIRLGEDQQPPPPPTVPSTHIVQDGETLWTIAAEHDLTLDELLAINGLTRGAIIKPGDEVRLRAPEPTPATAPPPTPTNTTVTAPAPTPTRPLTPTATAPAPTSTSTPTPTAIVTRPPSPTAAPSVTATITPMPPPPTGDETDSADQTVIAIGIAFAVVGVIVAFGGLVTIARSRKER